MKVIVYGTLKDGFGNNYLLRNSKFCGVEIVDGYRLYFSAGEGSFPFAKADNNYGIIGELYDITNDQASILSNLDSLEGVRYGLYTRELVVTRSKKTAYMYVGGKNFDVVTSKPVPDINNLCWWTR